jgi:hypothetical protein
MREVYLDTGPPLPLNVESARIRGGRGVPSGFNKRTQLRPFGVEGQATFIRGLKWPRSFVEVAL